ncbi:glucokinase [Chryseobacterium indoltheticum]|uniref:glucokinase n=1 Tax=Chryseobacterium indoltheticum TaxID=254 RepID=UPI003F49213A
MRIIIFRKFRIELKFKNNYPTKEYSSFSDVLSKFIQDSQLENVQRLGISVPGPVLDGKSHPARLNWSLDVEEYRSKFGFEKVDMLNDGKHLLMELVF